MVDSVSVIAPIGCCNYVHKGELGFKMETLHKKSFKADGPLKQVGISRMGGSTHSYIGQPDCRLERLFA